MKTLIELKSGNKELYYDFESIILLEQKDIIFEEIITQFQAVILSRNTETKTILDDNKKLPIILAAGLKHHYITDFEDAELEFDNIVKQVRKDMTIAKAKYGLAVIQAIMQFANGGLETKKSNTIEETTKEKK